MAAIVAATRDNALAVGLPNDVGVLEAGRLADIIILTRDPLADVRVLAGGQLLACVIKDGRVVNLADPATEDGRLSSTLPESFWPVARLDARRSTARSSCSRVEQSTGRSMP